MTATPQALGRAAKVTRAVERLRTAQNTSSPCLPVRDVLGDSDIALAYAVQEELTARRIADGAVIVGRKIGLTSSAVQDQLGVDQPDFGVLFADMDVSSLPEVPVERLLQPKAEAEVAFVLGSDLDADDLTVAVVRDAVSYATAALEIVDSRVAGWDIRITDTVADNASSGMYILGTRQVPLSEFEPSAVSMQLFVGDDLVSQGDGSACLGDPLNSLLWLARTTREYGKPLRAGQVVLSGALGPMVPATPGVTIRAELSSLGPVTATFSNPTTKG